MKTFLGVMNLRGYLDKQVITDDLPPTFSTTTEHISFSFSSSPLLIFDSKTFSRVLITNLNKS